MDNLPKDMLCPFHQLELEETSLPEDKITITIIPNTIPIIFIVSFIYFIVILF